MNRIGIISGGGELPLNIGKSLLKKNYQICFFYIKGYSDKAKYDNYENVEITIDSFSKILNLLKEKNIDQIVMAGSIIRPSLNEKPCFKLLLNLPIRTKPSFTIIPIRAITPSKERIFTEKLFVIFV